MRLRLAPSTTAALALLALAAGPGPAWGADAESPSAPRSVAETTSTDRVIVEWQPGATAARRAGARAGADTTMLRALGASGFQLVRTQPGQTAAQAAADLERDPAVRHAVPDSTRALEALPDDPMLGQQWGLSNLGAVPGVNGFGAPVAGADIGVAAAWAKTVGTPSTVVADIDSGYRFEHPDLADRAWTNPGEIAANGVDDDANGLVDDVRGWDFVGSNASSPVADSDPTDDNLATGGHGVHTAGIIGASGGNGIGIAGVAQDVRIMPLRVCSTAPSGGTCALSAIINAVNYAGRMGVRVANLSLGGVDNYNATELDAFAKNPQTLFVISAGNDGQDNDAAGKGHFPCNYGAPSTGDLPNIICVAATDQADKLAGYSDYGAQSVDLGAPGSDVLSTFPNVTTLSDDFEGGDVATRWTATGAAGGFTPATAAPLTSHGISNAGQAPSTTIQSTSAKLAPPDAGSGCVLSMRRRFTAGSGGDWFRYEILVNDASVGSSTRTASDADFSVRTFNLNRSLSPTDRVQLRLTYQAGTTPGSVSIDDLKIECIAPVGAARGYRFLDGTSMAAPHVTGAAALLLSLRPAATVAQVRSALLSSVDALPSLSGRTTTGGRLDAGKAVDAIEALLPAPPPPAPPASTTPTDTTPAVTQSAPAAAGQQAAGTAPAQATAPASERPATVQGASSAPVAAAAPRCKVPALAGLSLARAKTLLAKGHCALGTVKRPKAGGGTLVVSTASPAAGTLLPARTRIAVKLKVKRHRR